MGRYFEWLFPILHYLRLRREVSAWRAWGTVIAGIALLSVIICLIQVRSTMAQPMGGTVFLGSQGEWDILGEMLAVTGGTIAVCLCAVNAVALAVALLFVRHRPGRRRPLCTRRTLKFVALASQTWVFVVLAGIGVYFLLEKYEGRIPRTYTLEVAVGIFTAVLTTVMVGIGSIAVQAALAVIALQDDRRCEQCGYFLIGLTVPRCPECGKPFDPRKLAGLAEALKLEQEQEKPR
jgi:hypothetical protein